jgi:beta-glucosidase
MLYRVQARSFVTTVFLVITGAGFAQKQNIYHFDWIDFNKNGKKDVFEDNNQPIEKRIEDLLSQMTLEEKTCQIATLYGYGRVLQDELPTPKWKTAIWKDGIANIDEHLNNLAYNNKANTQYAYPFSKHAAAINKVQKWFVEETRLGVPVDFSNEGIHGLNHERATPLPAPIGVGSTWNPLLVRMAGEIIGREAKALGYTNVYAPILDPARDPRWGRVVECYGENPYHIAALGKEMVLGIQSQGVASTLKHFAVYSVPKGGRDGDARTDPHVAPREMHQLYLYPFKKVIKDAAPMGVMSSYNDWDGEPVTSSYYFLTELLRQKFGFNGYIVSDSEAVEFVFSKHHVAPNYKTAVKMVMDAGLDVRTNFTPPDDYINPARELVKEGSVSMKTLDERVANVLRVKFRLGLFDKPFVIDTSAADKIVHNKEAEAFELDINRQSLVLLKNENNLLPLDKNKYKKIMVCGPLATATNYAISRYGPSRNKVVSVLDGITKFLGNNGSIKYQQGCNITNADWPESEIISTTINAEEKSQIDGAVEAAKSADVVIAVVGEDERLVGESLTRTGLNLPGIQLQLLQALHATGKPIVVVLINGRPLTINWEKKFVPAILEAWFPGPSGGTAIAETLFGEYNPGGKLPVTFPKSVGQIELNFPYKPGSHAAQPSSGPNGHGKTSVNGTLFPFGYGLSYTTFEYSNLQISSDTIRSGGSLDVSVDIENIGKRRGDEVVQLYVKDIVSSVTAYEYDLRGFQRITLLPGEKKNVHFKLNPEDFEILDKHMEYKVEAGSFKIMIGSSSEDIKLEKQFEVVD